MRIAFICIFLFLVPQFQATEPDQVIEFFRHGARAPNFNYDPQWPTSELGLLTTVGMVQQYKLGKDLAAKYPNLIASGYNPDDVYALTNDVQRCIESALVQISSIFRGLTSTLTTSPQQSLIDSLIAEYTPSLDAGESSRGDYVPIQVDVVTAGTEENLIFDGRTTAMCPNLVNYQAENKLSTEFSQGWTTFQPPIQEANSYLSGSQVIKSMRGLYTAYDAFIADQVDGKTLPGGISDEGLVEKLGYGAAYYLFANEQLQKTQTQLTAFPTLKAVKDQLYNFRQGRNAKKLVLLSGHDKNIFAVLSAFGTITGDCLIANYEDLANSQTPSDLNCHFAGFASTLIFELYNTTSNPYVKVFYNNVVVPLCDGQDTCSYDDFMAFLDSTTEIDSFNTWNRKCGNPYDPEDPSPSVISSDSSGLSTGAIIGIAVGGAAACILVGVGAWILLKKKALIKLKPTNQNIRPNKGEITEYTV